MNDRRRVRRFLILMGALGCLSAADISPPVAPAVWELNLRQTLFQALESNRQLRVQRLTPAITETAIGNQQAAFDPLLSASIATKRQATPGSSSTAAGNPDGGNARADALTAEVAIEQTLATGTSWSLDAATTRQRSDFYDDASVVTRTGLTINQALLKGASISANLAGIHQARIDLDISRFELRGYTQALVAEVEATYWDHALAVQQTAIVERALAVAQQQLEQVKAFIAAGKIAGIELAAAEAEVAVRGGYVIDARSNRALTRLHLLRLLNPPGEKPLTRELRLIDMPFVPVGICDPVDIHVAVALRLRPDLNQARLQVERGDLDVVRTRNGLLPRLDFFVNLGRSGYAASFARSIPGDEGRGWDAQAGVRFAHTLGNREADSSHRQAQLSSEQIALVLAHQEQLAEADVRAAEIEVERLKEQLAATAVTRRAQEAKASAEREKFRVGKSTTLQMEQAERDALTSHLDEVRAVVNHLKALVELYRLDGSLLERRGIAAPGGETKILE